MRNCKIWIHFTISTSASASVMWEETELARQKCDPGSRQHVSSGGDGSCGVPNMCLNQQDNLFKRLVSNNPLYFKLKVWKVWKFLVVIYKERALAPAFRSVVISDQCQNWGALTWTGNVAAACKIVCKTVRTAPPPAAGRHFLRGFHLRNRP